MSGVSLKKKDVRKRKFKWMLGILMSLMAVFVILVGTIVGIKVSAKEAYASCMEAADRYLTELNYEDAEIQYRKAIQIDPKQKEPYLKLSETYMAQGNYTQAIEILRIGCDYVAKTGQTELEEQIQEVETVEEQAEIEDSAIEAEAAPEEAPTPEAPTPTPEEMQLSEEEERYQAYAEKIRSYEDLYGTATVVSDGYSYMTGLCFMKLVDFSHSGQEELLLVYHTYEESEYGTINRYTFEVWGFQNHEMMMLDSDEVYGGDGGSNFVWLTEVDGATYLVTGRRDDFAYNYFHGYSEDGFGIVQEMIKEPGENGLNCTINGEAVSQETFWEEEDRWLENVLEYSLTYECDAAMQQNEETKQRLAMN